MTNKKFNLTKDVWLILLCCGILFVGVTNSQALTLTNAEVTVGPSYASFTIDGTPVTYYTDYHLNADQFDEPLEAFCVENVSVVPGSEYELISLETISDDDLLNAAILADNYLNDPNSTFTDENGDKYSKEATQIAIWEILFDSGDNLGEGQFIVTDPATRAAAQEIVDKLNAGDFDFTEGGAVALAYSPTGTYEVGVVSQDYLVGIIRPRRRYHVAPWPGVYHVGSFGAKEV